VRSALGLQEDLVASVGMSKNRRDLEVRAPTKMVCPCACMWASC
jgi:hypothetical protein